MCVRERERGSGCVGVWCVCVRLEIGSERVADYTSHVSECPYNPAAILDNYVCLCLLISTFVCL